MFTNSANVSPESKPEVKPEVAAADASAMDVEDKVEIEENAADSQTADEQNVDKSIDPTQSRIDKLTKRFREAERETSLIRSENDRLLSELASRPEPIEPAKTLADFDYDESKYRDYIRDDARKAAEKAAERVVRELSGKSEADRVKVDFKRRQEDFAATVDDFEKVVYDDNLKISGVMAEEIRVSEIGPQMAYYLGKHPDESSELAGLSQRETVRRMTLLESRLLSEKSKTSKKVSDAPPPPPVIKAGDAGLEKDPAKMSDAEFARMRRKQIANR